MTRRSSRCAEVRPWSAITSLSITFMALSIEQISEALLHLVGDVERDGLDGGGRIDAAGGDEHAAVDDEQVLDVVRPAPFVPHGGFGIAAHPRGAEQMPAAIANGLLTQISVAPAAASTSLARAMPCAIIFVLFSPI